MNRTSIVIHSITAVAMLASTGCLDTTSATGELGRIDYALYTDYDPGLGDLTEVGILTGHTQELNLYLTERGEDDAADLHSVSHSISPSAGVTMEYDTDDEVLDDLYITVEQPGTYTLTTQVDGALFDTITLEFEAPASLDAVTWVRSPGAAEFGEPMAAQPTVDEGTQVSFVAIPLNIDGDRIAGEFDVSVSADPEGSVVEAYDTWGSYEDGIVGGLSEASVYFIEGGEITLTISDDLNSVDFVQTFDVVPAF